MKERSPCLWLLPLGSEGAEGASLTVEQFLSKVITRNKHGRLFHLVKDNGPQSVYVTLFVLCGFIYAWNSLQE